MDLSSWASTSVEQYGYLGLLVTLIVNHMGVPLASEVTLPLAGIAVKNGTLDIALVILVAVVGQMIGLTLAYWLARNNGLPLLERYGKYIFLHKNQILAAQRLLRRQGSRIIIVGLCMPGIHGYMGYPAGLEKMKFSQFFVLAIVGSFLWAVVLVGLGYMAGGHLPIIEQAFSGIGAVVVLALVATGAIWYSRRHWARISRSFR